MTEGHLPLTPTFIDGLLLAVNAVEDLQLVIDCANCGCDKFSVVGMNHDLHSTLIQGDGRQRACFSDLRANDLVLGTEDRLAETVRGVVADLAPKMVLLMASSAVQLVGSDLDNVALDLEEELGLPVAVVSPRTFDGEFLQGYAEGLHQVARHMALPPPSPTADHVALVGYRFDRTEEDHQGNLRELRRLLSALGLTLSTTWAGGEPLGQLAQGVCASERIISLPFGRRAARSLGRRLDQEVTELSLPVGLEGTARWVERLGHLWGRDDEARAFVESELEVIVPRLEWVVRHTFMDRRAALVLDPVLARELAPALVELGLDVPLIALQTRQAAQGEELAGHLGELSPRILTDPSFTQLEEAFGDAFHRGELDLIVGSGRARESAKTLPVPYLELGYPSYLRHALFDAPWLGFRGTLWLADVLSNLIRESEYRRVRG